MTRKYPGEGYTFNPASRRIEDGDMGPANQVKYKIDSVTVQKTPEVTDKTLYDLPRFFSSISNENTPQVYRQYEEVAKIFETFPEDAEQCFEDYELLQDPEVSAEELDEITERAVESMEERQGYLEILVNVLNRSYKEAKSVGEQDYYLAVEESVKSGRDRWHKVRTDVKDTATKSSEGFESEVSGAVEFIGGSTKVLGELKYSIQDANILFEVINQDLDLRNDLVRNQEKLAILVDEVPTSQGVKYKVNQKKLERFITANPTLLEKGAEEAQEEVVRVVEAMQSTTWTLEDRIGRLEPKVDAARSGINTRCRQIKAELWKLLDVLDTADLGGAGMAGGLRQRTEKAISKLEAASSQGQAAYAKDDLEPAEDVAKETEKLIVTLSKRLKSNTHAAGDKVVLALEEAEGEGVAILGDQKLDTEQARSRYRARSLKQTQEYERISGELVLLRDQLSRAQVEARSNLMDVKVARKLMELQQQQLAMFGAARNLMEESSDKAKRGYTDFYRNSFQGKFLHQPYTEAGDQYVETERDQLDVELSALGKSTSQLAALDAVSSTVNSIDEGTGQFISKGELELEELRGDYQEALRKSHGFLLGHLPDGLKDLIRLGHEVKAYHVEYPKESDDVVSEEKEEEKDNNNASEILTAQAIGRALDLHVAQSGLNDPSEYSGVLTQEFQNN